MDRWIPSIMMILNDTMSCHPLTDIVAEYLRPLELVLMDTECTICTKCALQRASRPLQDGESLTLVFNDGFAQFGLTDLPIRDRYVLLSASNDQVDNFRCYRLDTSKSIIVEIDLPNHITSCKYERIANDIYLDTQATLDTQETLDTQATLAVDRQASDAVSNSVAINKIVSQTPKLKTPFLLETPFLLKTQFLLKGDSCQAIGGSPELATGGKATSSVGDKTENDLCDYVFLVRNLKTSPQPSARMVSADYLYL